ncbi:MAG: hypothetical protein KKC26_03570 [Nanoarchaeota archaeon]|nr:hypothetical protein [Nanoarchaeota archaeon]
MKTKSEKLIEKYYKKKKELLKNPFDDHHGITRTKKDCLEEIDNCLEEIKRLKQDLKNKLIDKIDYEQKIIFLKNRINRNKKDLKLFIPQWSEFQTVIELLEIIDEYFEEQKLIEKLWKIRREGTFVDWDKVKDDI